MTHTHPESHRNQNFALLRISTFAELLSHEAEIVRRIALIPNGGWLLELDPQRLFRDLRVELTPAAADEWKVRYPDFFKRTGNEYAYDAMAKSRTQDRVTVVIDGLFRKERA